MDVASTSLGSDPSYLCFVINYSAIAKHKDAECRHPSADSGGPDSDCESFAGIAKGNASV